MAYYMHYAPVGEGENTRAKLSFVRDLNTDEEAPGNADGDFSRSIQIIDTDYHLYAVGMHCDERNNPDSGEAEHTEDYFVLTREKEPSIYMRRRAREALIA